MIKHRKALKVVTCFSCGEAILPRSFYFRNTSFEPARGYCEKCFSSGSPDYLMWTGSQNYLSIEAFVSEAQRLGVCKRVASVPSDLKPGVSRVFLAHDEGVKGAGRIFGFFPIMAVRLILDDPQAIEAYRQKLGEIPLEVLSTQQAQETEERGCGYLVEGAIYLVSYVTEDSMNRVFNIAKPLADHCEVRGGIIVFKNPIPIPHIKRFRGIKHLEAGLIPPLDELGIQVGRKQEFRVTKEVTIQGG